MAYKLKIGPAQGLKLKGNAGFALPLIGRTGIKATKTGGIWYVDIDYTTLTPGPVSDPTTAFVAIEDKTAGIYREVSLASLLTSGLDADLQAIAALTTTGVLSRTADSTWALRAVTGTANEITVTNGDGVSGNPTLSLPAALAFTGKTITGGTYTGVVSINGNIWTAGTGTLTLGAGKTATISNTLTFTGTDGSTAAFGAGGTVAYQGSSLAQFAATTSAQLAGVISDETGTGSLVFATSPTLVTPTLGAASATSINKVAITAPAVGSTLTIADGATLTAPATASVSGTNTGDQTITLTGDVTGTGTGSFAATIGATKVTSAMLNADVFSTAHSWSGVQTFTNPVVGTQTAGDNSTKAASTAFVQAAVTAGVSGVASIAGNTGAFTLSGGITNSANDIRIDGRFDFRNRIINPTGQIQQIAHASTADGSYSGFDQWYVLTEANPVTPSTNVAPEPGTPSMMRLTQSNASAQRFGWATPLEVDNARGLRGQTVTLSARVQMSASTTLRYAVIEWSGAADAPTKDVVNNWSSATFTTGNFFISTTTAISAQGSIALTANTLTSITPLTFTLGNTHQNLIAFFWTDSQQAQNVTLDLGKVQLEVGSSATQFAIRPTALEQTLCNRFLRVIGNGLTGTVYFQPGLAFSTTIFRSAFTFESPMRVAPTATASAASDFSVDDSGVGGVGSTVSFTTYTGGFQIQLNTGATLTAARAGMLYNSNNSARIYLKAQL